MRTAPRLMFNKGVGVDFAVVSEAVYIPHLPFLPALPDAKQRHEEEGEEESLNLIKEDKRGVNHAARRK